MHIITHLIVAFLLAHKLRISYFAAIFALLPDIDFLLPTHRKFTHSFAAMLLCFPIALIFGLAKEYILGFGSHLILDMLTPLGVQLFWPLPYHFVLFNGLSNKKVELIIVALAFLINLV